MMLIYVTIYTAELAAALQQGGCYALEDINVDQVLSWFTGGDSDIAVDTTTDSSESMENPIQDIIDELDSLQATVTTGEIVDLNIEDLDAPIEEELDEAEPVEQEE